MKDKYDIKLIALDLDGTTLNSQGKLSDENREAIEEAIAGGISVAVASGRVLSAIPESMLSIEGIDFAITSNGARVTDLRTHRNVYSNCIAPESLVHSVDVARANGLRLEAFWNDRAFIDAEMYRDIDENGSSYRNREYVLSTREPVEDLYGEMLKNKDRIENINIFFNDISIKDEVFRILSVIENVTLTTSVKNNVEIGGASTSKSDALKFLSESLGIDRENIMSFGDAPNDIAMIEFAGLGVAVGNAWGGTKEHADYVAETNDESGVGKTIRKFCFGD